MRGSGALGLFFAALPALAQVCAPSPSGEHPHRPAMTRRAPAAAVTASISVATFQAWSPPDGADDAAVRGRDRVIDAREEQAATLEGDLWRVKVGGDGCALVLELSATSAGRDAPRVVAVIPAGAGYDAARSAVAAAAGVETGRSSRHVDLAEAVRVRLTGYLFWNGARWCEDNPGRGCGHRADVVASLWELHPVWRAELVGAGGEATARRHHHGRHHHGRHRHGQ